MATKPPTRYPIVCLPLLINLHSGYWPESWGTPAALFEPLWKTLRKSHSHCSMVIRALEDPAFKDMKLYQNLHWYRIDIYIYILIWDLYIGFFLDFHGATFDEQKANQLNNYTLQSPMKPWFSEAFKAHSCRSPDPRCSDAAAFPPAINDDQPVDGGSFFIFFKTHPLVN